jgi:hypothetical protein
LVKSKIKGGSILVLIILIVIFVLGPVLKLIFF